MTMTEGTPMKEPPVLRNTSLLLLANGLGKQELKGMELAMYLNIPTTTIVTFIGEITGDSTISHDSSENDRIILAYRLVLLWKEMTKNEKPKERVKTMEMAIRQVGRQDIADVFMERYSNNEELTKDVFEESS